MSLEEAARRTVEGMAGRLLLSAAITVILGASGWTAHQIYDHGEKLSGISQKIDDLVVADTERVRVETAHDAVTDAAIGKLVSDGQMRSVAIARAETEIENLQAERTPRAERESFAASAPQAPPNVFNALSHIFSPSRPHWRRRN